MASVAAARGRSALDWKGARIGCLREPRPIPLLSSGGRCFSSVFGMYMGHAETAPEGPYGDHTAYYKAVEEFPVFHVTAVTMRQNPIYLSTFTGRPPDDARHDAGRYRQN